MSYILDALKKAEQEREFGEVPGIDSLHEQPAPRPPRRWPWVLVAVLLLNALVVAGLWWWSGGGTSDVTAPTTRSAEPIAQGVPDRAPGAPAVSQADPAPRVEPAAPPAETDGTDPPATEPAPQPPVVARRTLRPLPEPAPTPRVKPVAPPVEKDSTAAPAVEPTAPPPAVVRRPLRPLPLPDPLPTPVPAKSEPLKARKLPAPTQMPSVAPSLPPEVVELKAPIPPPPPEAEPAWKRLPLWPLVPDNILRQVKERLELNVHVYSEQPMDRFVLFNMKKYREGEQISEGLKLEQITREGVVLAVPNGRFRLDSR